MPQLLFVSSTSTLPQRFPKKRNKRTKRGRQHSASVCVYQWLIDSRHTTSSLKKGMRMRHERKKIEHAVGEVVIGALGNFCENWNAVKKARPAVVLASGNCQHTVAGLTTQEFFKTTGNRRKKIPNPIACGLRGDGYLFSHRPAKLSRIDLHKHVGWVDHAMVRLLAETMHLPPKVVSQLWHVANQHHGGASGQLSA